MKHDGADQLRPELAHVAEEQALRRAGRRSSPCRRRRCRARCTPQMPLTPCTEIAPTGSSILQHVLEEDRPRADEDAGDARRSRRRAIGLTKPDGAVIATRPASMPLTIMPGSGLPSLHHV